MNEEAIATSAAAGVADAAVAAAAAVSVVDSEPVALAARAAATIGAHQAVWPHTALRTVA